MRALLLLLGACLIVPVTAVLAFFIAGAIVFPIVEPYYASRILLSAGLMALVYGVENVLSWGTIETCGFLSGNCTIHRMYEHSLQVWYVLLGIGLTLIGGVALRSWFEKRNTSQEPSSSSENQSKK